MQTCNTNTGVSIVRGELGSESHTQTAIIRLQPAHTLRAMSSDRLKQKTTQAEVLMSHGRFCSIQLQAPLLLRALSDAVFQRC
jgi:hypothetical protein